MIKKMMVQASGSSYKIINKKNLYKAISDMDIQGVSDFLINMFKSEATYGYLSPSFSRLQK